MSTSKTEVPVLLLASVDGGHAERSGYPALAHYINGAEQISTVRSEPKGIVQRGIVAGLSRLALTRWYRLGSASLEWKAWRRLSRFHGVVHMMWADRDLGFLDLARNRERHRLCATFHCCPDTFPENLQFPSRLRRLDAVILVSKFQRRFFELRGVPADRIHVVLHGVDTEFFRPAATPRKEELFQVLSVGSYRRNFALLRKVCERMACDRSVRFKIIAPEPFSKLFAGLENVDFISRVSDQELVRAYQGASCFLLTVDSSTANNALLEAMACGLPIISESIGGIPEYAEAGSAELVSPASEILLAEAVTALAREPERCRLLGMAARRRAEELDWSRVAERTEAVYRAIA